jgi:hypothetical protein
MSFNLESLNIKEKTDDDVSSDESDTLTNPLEHLTMPAQSSPKQRRTSEPVVITKNVNGSPERAAYPLDQVTSQSKASPKQRRTSEPLVPSNNELRELVQIRNSPSPRRSKKGVSSLASTNGTIDEDPDTESDSPSRSRRRRNNTGTSNKISGEYVEMAFQTEPHTYVNLTPGEGLEGSEDGPMYMNFLPGNIPNHGKKNVEEHSYMNFTPGEIIEEKTAKESPSYMNFSPGSVTRSESFSPRQKRKHAYENLNFNGRIKETNEFESHDYMNFSPRGSTEDKSNAKANTSPSSPRGSLGSLMMSPTSGRPRRMQRRESEPAPSGLISDEETGMLFLDFSKKSKPEKALNYVSLDLSKNKKRSGSKSLTKPRPSSINTSACHKRSWDTGPKSAPIDSGYSEIDFAKSQGLRQAILEHEKAKPQK